MCTVVFDNESKRLSLVITPFAWVYNWLPRWLAAWLKQILFNNDFPAFCWRWNASPEHIKRISHSVAAQAWVECFHICRHKVKHGSLLLIFYVVSLAVFPVEHISNDCYLDKTRLCHFCKFVLIGFRINSKNAVMFEVLMFRVECNKPTGVSLISTFNKGFGGHASQCIDARSTLLYEVVLPFHSSCV